MSKFQTTEWSVIARAGSEEPESRQALSQLCGAYWYPLYSFLRRRDSPPHDAEDAVQEFFAWLLEADVLARADRERGRFRTFLLAVFQQYLARRQTHDAAAKRRPGQPMISIDAATADGRYQLELLDYLTPEKQFERAWAVAVVERAKERLQAEWEQKGLATQFALLRPFLTGTRELNGRELASKLNTTEGAVRVGIHRLKRRYGELLRDEVGQTVEEDSDIDQELGHLLAALRGS